MKEEKLRELSLGLFGSFINKVRDYGKLENE